MINASGVLQRITNEGGTDVNPAGITALASLLPDYPTLALSASAGKVGTLFAHYAYRFPKLYNDRVTTDSGTFIAGRATDVLVGFRLSGGIPGASLIVPCDAGKASVLYAIENLGLLDAVLDEATAEAFDAESDFLVIGVPDMTAIRTTFTSVDLAILNGGSADAKYYKATGVLGNFANLTTVSSPYAHTDTVTSTADHKYKASFIVNGTRNSVPRVVEGQKCAPSYVIAETSTTVITDADTFIARVIADGGSVADIDHTREVFLIEGSSLLVPCSAGKVSVLYAYVP